MSAMDGFEDPEETAGDAANRAFQKVLLARSVRLFGLFAAVFGGVAADYVFGVMALWLLPRALTVLLASFVAGEVSVWVRSALAARAERRKADAVLSKGERQEAALDRMRSKPLALPWWREGPRSRRFWLGLVFRTVYSAAAGLVLVHFFGMPAGVVLAVAFTALVLAVRARAAGVIASWVTVASFADPRPPRDTPET